MSSTTRSSRRRCWSAVVVAGFATGLSLGPLGVSTALAAPAAAGPDRCSTVLVDGAGVLGKATTVTGAASALTRAGALVRVRTYRSVPGGDLDAAVKAEVDRCPGWRDGGRGRRPELLVLAVSIGDRKTVISYGSRWREPLDLAGPDVHEEMGPLLKRKQHAAAMTAGLKGLHTAITDASADPAAPADPSAPAGPLEDPAAGETGGPAEGVELLREDPFTSEMPFGSAGPGGSGIVLVVVVGFVIAVLAALGISVGGGGGGTGRRSGWSPGHGGTGSGTFWGSTSGSFGSGSSFGSSHSSGSSSSGSSSDSGSGSSSGSSSSDGGGSSSSSW